jgi:eukaryotic-like serine/threonine-protein kinase
MDAVGGQSIGNRYIIMDKLGEGGMGAVYRAVDGLTGQTIALKRVAIPTSHHQPTDETSGMRLALAQEFRTLATLRHPHVISVLDYGFDEDRQPFFTMDYLEGAQTLLEAGRQQPIEGRIELVLQMLQAVAYLHRRGIIHRDLKPANVLVADGQVKVLDFGLSVFYEQAETPEDEIAGTLAYLAPEVIRGERPTESADLYAIGVMIYELLTGHHPFDSGNVNQLVSDILMSRPDLVPLYNLLHTPKIDTISFLSDIQLDTESVSDSDSTDFIVLDPFEVDEPVDEPIETGNTNLFWADDGDNPSLVNIVDRLLAKTPAARYLTANEVIERLCVAIGQSVPAESAAIRESYLQAARFVGREVELDQLEQALDMAVQGQGSSWLVGGEIGVGKSRLLDELRVRALVDGCMVLRGQGVEGGGLPYQLWRESLRRIVLTMPVNDLDAAILKDIVPDIDRLQRREIVDVSELEGSAYQQRLMGTIASLFQQQRQPILMLLEDLQWSKESLDVLKHINGMVADLPILMVGTYRDDERPNLPEALPGMKLMKLERLTPNSIAALSVSMLGEAGAQPHIVNFLHRETEGNVYFMVEVVRVLAEEAGRLGNVTRFTLPQQVAAGGIRSVMRRRLSRVPEESLPLLRLAAVAGRELQLEILEQVKGGLNLDEWLTTCANSAVIEVQEGTWRFSHDKLRDATLETISAEVLPLLHRQIAEGIEAVHGSDPDQAAILALHWRSAGDALKERIYAQRAGEHSLSISAFSDAVTHLERALELLPTTISTDADPRPIRAHLRLKLGESLKYMGDYATATAHLEEALKLRREVADQEGIAEASVELGDLLINLGDYTKADKTFDEGLSIYRSLNHVFGIAWALERAALNLIQQGDYPNAIRLSEESLVLGRSINEARLIANAINSLGVAAFAQGDYRAATGYFEETLAICRAGGERRRAAAALLNLGSAAGEQHDYEAANRCFEESLAIFRNIGERRLAGLTLNNLGVIAEFQGDYERASYYLEESLALARAIGNRVEIANSLVNLGNTARTQGQMEHAADLYHQALYYAQEIEAVPLMLEGLTGLASINNDHIKTLEWLGLILNHLSANEGTRQAATPVLVKLTQRLTTEEVERHLERGKTQDLKAVIAGILHDFTPPQA